MMDRYSVHQVAKQLGINKDTLRYYDKIGIIKPSREKNKYRYYLNYDLIMLKCIQVMKYAQFSLSDIKTLMNQFYYPTDSCKDEISVLLKEKQKYLLYKITQFNKIIEFITVILNKMENDELDQSEELEKLISQILNEIN